MTRAIFIIWAILGCSCIGFSQKLVDESLIRKSAFKVKRMAKQSLRYQDSYTAIELYELYLTKRPKNSRAKYELAQLYQQVRNYNAAFALYNELVLNSPDEFPKAWFYKGQCEKSLGKLDEARDSFEEFSDRYRGLKDRRIFRRLLKAENAGLDIADSLVSNKLPATVRPIKQINNAYSEAAPLFVSDSVMYFASIKETELTTVSIDDSLEAEPRLVIYEAHLTKSGWETVGPLNGEIISDQHHISNPVIGPEGRYLYYTVCSENWKGKTLCKIFQSRKVNDTWKRPEEMNFGINESGYTSTQPAIGLDIERNRPILYFVSDRPGGRGGLDIYHTRYNRRKDAWDKPRNAGSKINTVGDEETPWYDLKNGTLYFSSNGHPGIGGMDVFSAVGERSKWSEPEILGVPINSHSDDVYFRKQPRERYQVIVSNRPGSQSLWNQTCCDDIYEVFYPSNTNLMLKISAFELPIDSQNIEERNLLIESKTNVYLYDSESGEKYLIKTDSLPNGQNILELPPGRVYLVEVEKPGYFTQSKIVDTRKSSILDSISTELSLKPWDDSPITIPNIYFEFGSAQITDESQMVIDTTLLALLNENPKLIIEISAHTDSKGSTSLNQKLSEKRAASITSYLIKKGIDKSRLTSKGYGETRPIAPNENADGTDNPEGRAKNRRVDFRVIGTKLTIESSE